MEMTNRQGVRRGIRVNHKEREPGNTKRRRVGLPRETGFAGGGGGQEERGRGREGRATEGTSREAWKVGQGRGG